MATLLLNIEAPLQSWGRPSQYNNVRATELHPTKSAIIGLIANAQGRMREDNIDDLNRLKVHVRINRPGSVIKDFQTISGTVRASGAMNPNPVISDRFYLSDAAFTVAIEGPWDELQVLHDALKKPRRLLFFGRKSCTPSAPIILPNALQDVDPLTALRDPERDVQVVRELNPGELGVVKYDTASNYQERQYSGRMVRREVLKAQKGEV